MAASDVISFARGAPSLDIVDVEGLKDAAARAFANDPGGATGYGTSIGYVPLRRWIAERHGVGESQVLVTNGSMQADAFLFDELVGAGDAVIVERPTYDRTLLSLTGRGADVHMVELETDGIDVDALGELLDGRRRAEARPHHPQLPEPGRLHAVGRQAPPAARARRASTTSSIFEDDPYVELRFAGEQLPTMLSHGPRRPRRLRVVVLQDGLPRHPRRLPRRPRAGHQLGHQARDEHLHLAEHGRRGDRLRVLHVGRDRALDRDGQGGALGARRHRLPTR